jgi:succinate dehydrogenase/fumarate reductase flavoprotein subunit
VSKAEATTCDVLVVGSGAGGLAAAITARKAGLDVIVIEKEHMLGGTTAFSGGFIWIPQNSLSRKAGVKEAQGDARTYLQSETGNHFDAARVDAFLKYGPEMVDFFQTQTQVRFAPALEFADYHPDGPGGMAGGRSLGVVPFDLKNLGAMAGKIRPPLIENTVGGITIGTGQELTHFYNANRSLRSAVYVAWRFAKHLRDLLFHGRSMWSTMGNALVSRLVRSAMDLDIPIWDSSSAQRLITRDGAVTGALVSRPNGEVEVYVRRGVVLACGGFPHDKERQRSLYPHVAGGAEHFGVPPSSNSGDGLRLAERVGGIVENMYPNHAAWVPVSKIRRKDGSVRVFPHFVDRYKPGVIAVNRNGKRFVNEANSYHDFVQGMFQFAQAKAETTAFLICDHATVRRYGMGFAKPSPIPLKRYLESGYILQGNTLEELANKAGFDSGNFANTVAEFNRDAVTGVDTKFGKGSTAYNRLHGDKSHKPNPCMAPVAIGPFYAIQVFPGEIGSFAGLRTDANSRVLNAAGAPIQGLYAVGNDMASVMGGNYPGGGITLGPAMTFGFIAGRHLSENGAAASAPTSATQPISFAESVAA